MQIVSEQDKHLSTLEHTDPLSFIVTLLDVGMTKEE